MRYTGITTAIVFIYLLISLQVSAQVSGSFELGSGYDDNAFGNSSMTETSYGSAALTLGIFPEESRFGISYSGLFATFGAFPERRYGIHSLIASYTLPYGEEERNSLIFAGSFNLRNDAEEYAYYDYSQGMGYLYAKHYFTETMSGRAGYTLKYRKYPNFDDMSYTEHLGWLGLNTAFESRTSVILRAEIGIKNYAPVTESVYAADPGTAATSGRTGNGFVVEGGGPGGSGNGGNGGGNGNGGSGNGGSGNGSMGQNGGRMSQIGQHYSGMGETAQIITYDDAITSQLRTSLTVGQGLTDELGLSATYVKRFNLDDRSRAIVGGTVDFIGEEELFDDPYSYESDEASLKLTQILPAEMKLQLGGFMLWKHYSYVSNLEDLASPLRNDRKYGGYASLSKTIGGSWLMFSGLELTLGYTYTRNESNTTWYDYSANGVSFGIGTEF